MKSSDHPANGAAPLSANDHRAALALARARDSKTTTLAEEFEDYARVLPVNASDTQRKETRRAFYAGAIALQSLMGRNLSSEGGKPSPSEISFMLTLQGEFDKFSADIANGRA